MRVSGYCEGVANDVIIFTSMPLCPLVGSTLTVESTVIAALLVPGDVTLTAEGTAVPPALANANVIVRTELKLLR